MRHGAQEVGGDLGGLTERSGAYGAQFPAMATTGLLSGLPPMDPKKAALNEKTPPSEATNR